DWYYQSGASFVFPDAFEHFVAPIPEHERDDLVQSYYRRLTDPKDEVRMPAAKAWSIWEGSTSTLHANPEMVAKSADPHFAEAFARIECHYFVHGGFMERENQLLEN